MTIEEKISSLGYTLPEAPAPAGSYVNCVRSGNLLFLAGGIPPLDDDKYLGKVPTDTSLETAQEVANSFKHSVHEEISLLFIHGLLHLLGFDHENDSGEMRDKEKEIIKHFSLSKSLIVRVEGEN